MSEARCVSRTPDTDVAVSKMTVEKHVAEEGLVDLPFGYEAAGLTFIGDTHTCVFAPRPANPSRKTKISTSPTMMTGNTNGAGPQRVACGSEPRSRKSPFGAP